MNPAFTDHLRTQLDRLQAEGLFKRERVITSRQGPWVEADGKRVVNLCANNYLGLAGRQELVDAAVAALPRWGFGMSSVRFICGTQDIHKELEQRLARYLGFEDAILFSSCFDANGGVFEALLGEEDAVVSDALNHASIIDGIRLCKARRYRYANGEMADLAAQLAAADAAGARFKLVVTDGVFSMDGYLANLPAICDLAGRHGAMVMVDDSHAVGFIGEHGRGTHEHHRVMGRVDLVTGTLGKALGGASGGYAAGSREVVEWLRQKARPYLFSNTLAPVIAATSIAVLDLLESGDGLRRQLRENARHFRAGLTRLGFELLPGEHPIIPVMLHEAPLAQEMARRLLDEGVYVTGFFFPVVPKGQARIRTQMSAAHSREDLDHAVAAFEKVGRALGVI
ncbi:glycine C-acetyltransferase [Anaeromyxobacter sp. PSR-1]|uniref:glycine C-acetyltransferase n=1 Tax=Anaeromyxobacter sp. PSR-1 TaxID=1300915 RepID=UPI0005DF8736|nr:glycine C-acetyltransferase [Anaeromyxobacter sp. PSR-1]GAO02480.1 2-amino-3-ketobutyrate coenzyme A ligase [Anaeromyxobacter sp. PSR-1]